MRKESGGALYGSFELGSLAQVFAFMTQDTLFGESQSHYPEWVNECYRGEVRISTHDVGRKNIDEDLANAMIDKH